MPPKPFVPGSPWSGSHITPSMSHSAGSANEIASYDSESPPCDSLSETPEEKPSHYASVFVGSLPCNLDQAELTKSLSEHLSEYAEIKNIKVVRDAKGGICAFVQCENADAASDLIQKLQTQKPKPFMGRILRFEPARAFRTLLISYRAPSGDMSSFSPGSPHTTQPSLSLDLPTAMRIWKPRGSRFHNVLYNHDAAQTESIASQNTADSEDRSIFLQPLKFDEQTIQDIAAYFGPVEKFVPFRLSLEAEGECDARNLSQSYPAPHNSPRSPVMDNGCWEVKWDFRDDCISALMALRRVPHLSVSWAHQPSSPNWEYRQAGCGHLPQSIPAPYPFQPPRVHSTSISSHALPRTAHPGSSFNLMGAHMGSGASAQQPPVYVPQQAIVQPSPTEPAAEWNGWRSSNSRDSFMPPNAFLVDDESHLGQSSEEIATTPLSTVVNTPVCPSIHRNSTDDKPYVHLRGGFSGSLNQRSIDPTSLFVGGLETLGPSAWDEEKVRKHFAKYGGLQTVKFVRPFHGTTGFAFLKFDNADGPARAVLEEHNRVFNGHVMRVRLKDCNPPRNTWKTGRGRGYLYHHNGHKFQFHDKFDFKPPLPIPNDEGTGNQTMATPLQANEERSPSRNTRASPSTEGQTLHDESPPPSPSVSEKSGGGVSSHNANLAAEPNQRYREWYDDLDASTGSALPVSASMTVFPPPPYPYVFPNMPFYGPPPWVQSYIPPQPPYPVPYFGAYPMYPPPMMPPPIHPVAGGEQDSPSWSPQGIVCSRYALPTPLRSQPTEDYRLLPSGYGPSPVSTIMAPVGEQTVSACPTTGVALFHPLPPAPSLSAPSGKANISEPSRKFQNLHDQPQLTNGAPPSFLQSPLPSLPSWGSNTHIPCPPAYGAQHHVSSGVHQPPFSNPSGPAPEHGAGRPYQSNGKRRESFKKDAQPHFQGNRFRGHNGRVNTLTIGGPTHQNQSGAVMKGKPTLHARPPIVI